MQIKSIQPMAAKILAEETGKMIIATKQLFYAMEVHKLLHFQNADMSAVSFAMTVHGLMDYELDLRSGECKTENQERNNLDEYLQWFCRKNFINYCRLLGVAAFISYGFVEIKPLKVGGRISIEANCCMECRMVAFRY